jgi:peptidoglycan/xylan/chitin deacetylase (PgdA/CDA1 family)
MKSQRFPIRLATATCAAAIVGLLLIGCAPHPAHSPVGSWSLPTWPLSENVEVVSPPASSGLSTTSSVIGQRLRNDKVQLNARYGYVPGDHPFNEYMDSLLWQAIERSGEPYTPLALDSGAGMQSRGCVAGSSQWTAAQLLANPETGPPGGTGTAIVCDTIAEFGGYFGQTIRTVVATTAGKVDSDSRSTLYVAVGSDTIVDGSELWIDSAAAAVWTLVVDKLRREAGALSLAPVLPPEQNQLDLIGGALKNTIVTVDGLVVQVPAGITSPELSGLEVAPTVESINILVAGDVLSSTASPTGLELLGEANSPVTPVQSWAGLDHVDCSLLPCVALTYDDGPSEFTPELLDTLEQKRAPATFFVLVGAAKAHSDVVRRAVHSGHDFGTHTWSHPKLPTLNAAQLGYEIRGSANSLAELTGKPTTMFRPPYGEYDAAVLKVAGMPAILWDVDTKDWSGRSIDEITAQTTNQSRAGSIVLFHDTHASSVTASGGIIDGLRDRGFSIVTLTQLFDGTVPAGAVTNR